MYGRPIGVERKAMIISVIKLGDTTDADEKAGKRREIKSQAGLARRGIRYQQPYLPGMRTRLARKTAKA